jgi:hypothetical protein
VDQKSGHGMFSLSSCRAFVVVVAVVVIPLTGTIFMCAFLSAFFHSGPQGEEQILMRKYSL